jgi:hypothetical protein
VRADHGNSARPKPDVIDRWVTGVAHLSRVTGVAGCEASVCSGKVGSQQPRPGRRGQMSPRSSCLNRMPALSLTRALVQMHRCHRVLTSHKTHRIYCASTKRSRASASIRSFSICGGRLPGQGAGPHADGQLLKANIKQFGPVRGAQTSEVPTRDDRRKGRKARHSGRDLKQCTRFFARKTCGEKRKRSLLPCGRPQS